MGVAVLMNSYKESEPYFRKAVRSALAAGCAQLILSTVRGDDCLRWANDYPIQVVVNRECGIFTQLNAMLPHIREPYVCYASSNDYMLKHKLSLERSLLGESKKVCYSSIHIHNKITGRQYVHRAEAYSYRRHLLESFVSDCAMVETETFLKYTPFRVKYNNSAYRDLWLRIFEGEGDVFIHNDRPTWVYVVTADSQHVKAKQNKDIHNRRMDDRHRMLRDHLPHAKQLLGDDVKRWLS